MRMRETIRANAGSSRDVLQIGRRGSGRRSERAEAYLASGADALLIERRGRGTNWRKWRSVGGAARSLREVSVRGHSDPVAHICRTGLICVIFLAHRAGFDAHRKDITRACTDRIERCPSFWPGCTISRVYTNGCTAEILATGRAV